MLADVPEEIAPTTTETTLPPPTVPPIDDPAEAIIWVLLRAQGLVARDHGVRKHRGEYAPGNRTSVSTGIYPADGTPCVVQR